VALLNRGPQSRTFTISVRTVNDGNWLSASTGGSLPAFDAALVAVDVNASQLAPGYYRGEVRIAVAPTGESFDVPVSVAVASNQQSIVTSQSGLTFRAVAGGEAVPPQTVAILPGGAGQLNWSAATSTLAGGNWLAAVRTGNTVEVHVNRGGLAAGEYHGRVQIMAEGASNSPQFISVVLNVLAPDIPVSPVIAPTGLIFVGQQGGPNPQPQTVTISNVSRRALTFSTASYFEQGKDWFMAAPTSGSVIADQSARLTVEANTAGLAAGVYQGELSVRFAEDNSLRRIAVLLVVVPRPGAASTANNGRFAEGCTPKKLYPVFTALGSNFQTTAAWPTTLEVRVVDDCGDMMTAGTVTVTFSSGDPPVALTSLRDGRWSGTWQPRDQNARQVTVTVRARTTIPPLEGTAQIGGGVQTNNATPALAYWGAMSAASYKQQWPVAPGSLVSIFGARLADGITASSRLPLATELAGTQVFLAGRSLPLQFTSDGQINAVIPYDIPVNSIQQMLVRKGTSYSVPEPVNVATAQPAVFTQNLRGDGSGIVIAVKADGRQLLVSPDAPASAGDVLVIYCTGLGPVDQRVEAGTAAPTDPLARTVNSVSVTLAGRSLQVLFAGLAPAFTGLYQVNAIVPADIAPAPDVPLVLTVSEQSSAPVTVAVR
jgi:uncharacterized protein (TIGR03437 family)